METEFLKARSSIALTLSGALALIYAGCGSHHKRPVVPVAPSVFGSLQDEFQKSYLTLFKISLSLHYAPDQFRQMKIYLDHAKGYCTSEFKSHADRISSRIKEVESTLHHESPSVKEKKDHALHCEIQHPKIQRSQDHVLADHAMSIAYQNKQAKLELTSRLTACGQNLSRQRSLHRKSHEAELELNITS